MPILTTAIFIGGKFVIKKLIGSYLEHWGVNEWAREKILDTADDFASKTFQRLTEDPKVKLGEALDAIANANPADFDAALDEAVSEQASDQPAVVQAALRNNLHLAAERLRQARHLSVLNVAGQPTIPPSLLPAKPEDLLSFLPLLPPSGRQPGQTLYPRARGLTLVRFLGVGGFGEVWETRNDNDAAEKHRAVKIFTHPQAARFIELEDDNMARVTAMMRANPHPGIVPILDQYLDRSPPSLAYELVRGRELSALIREWHAGRGGPAPLEAARVLLRLAEIVAHCHKHGIIHRDLKPANILVTAEGKLRITDFGLSQANAATEQGAAARARQSRAGVTALKGSGTMGYAPPEQFDRNSEPDVREDIHALGVIGYELLTNGLPSGGLSKAKSRKLVEGGVPEAFVDLLSECLEQDREDRLVSAQTLVEGLRALLSLPITSPPALSVSTIPLPKRGLLDKLFGGLSSSSSSPSTFPSRPASSSPNLLLAEASRERPYVNSLGMKFIPVPITGGPTDGQRVLFCVHQIRRQDYAAYAAADSGVDDSWKSAQYKSQSIEGGNDHPVVNVSWEDAQAFCAWLSKKDGISYRLPSDHEWSCAVGIGSKEKASAKLEEKDDKLGEIYPWGMQWPPPQGAGNYADSSAAKAFGKDFGVIEGYHDGYASTAPVMQFTPSAAGLFDLGGNVWEWCQDKYSATGEARVLRGGSWCDNARANLRSAYRSRVIPGNRLDDYGFRVVVGSVGR